jgi:orotidine-5'-phosphate decarboxylase
MSVSGAGDGMPAPGPATAPFGDRLAAAVAARESQIVLGIDPDPARLWPAPPDRTSMARADLAQALAAAHEAAREVVVDVVTTPGSDFRPLTGGVGVAPPALEAAAAVLAHSLALIEAAGPACVAAKPQLACFERLGFAGALALELVCVRAAAVGLLVLADGKRGDVPVTASAYAQALVGYTPSPFGRVYGLGVDALTANPLLGRDAVEPLVADARRSGAGVFVLVRTSNPGAADLMDLPLATGEPFWERLAALADTLGETGSSGLKDVGAVTGATAPQHLARMRELMPSTPFLLPGVGAQGGDVGTLAPAFAPGRAAGLVTASRSIANAYEDSGKEPAVAARAEAERLRELAWSLA